jgi:hypothetical protein
MARCSSGVIGGSHAAAHRLSYAGSVPAILSTSYCRSNVYFSCAQEKAEAVSKAPVAGDCNSAGGDDEAQVIRAARRACCSRRGARVELPSPASPTGAAPVALDLRATYLNSPGSSADLRELILREEEPNYGSPESVEDGWVFR